MWCCRYVDRCSSLPCEIFLSAYFDQHLPLQPSIEKRRKQSFTPNISHIIVKKLYSRFSIVFFLNLKEKYASYEKMLEFKLVRGKEGLWE